MKGVQIYLHSVLFKFRIPYHGSSELKLGEYVLLKHLCISFAILCLVTTLKVRAQDLPGDLSGSKDVEDLYEKEEVKGDQKPKPAAAQPPNAGAKSAPKQVSTLSDLATLAPFTDVAVIQRRFLPKTGRYEFAASLFQNLNNPFFNSLGVAVRAAYYIRERYAVELLGAFASTSSRQVTDDLLHNRQISTDNVVTSKGFYALAFKWNPIYGKVTLLNKSIVPFDLNFNLGLGVTPLMNGTTAPTLHLGTSQVFAWTKSIAFRWDIIWNTYQATITDSTSGAKSTLSQNDLFLGVGMSFFFPEATYR